MIVLTLLLVAVGIGLLFRLLHWLLRPLARRQTLWQRADYLLVGIEVLTWAGWLFWVIHHLTVDRTVYVFYTVIISLLLLGAVAWFILRDLVAGVVFKIQHNLKVQQPIQVIGQAGRLIRLGATTLMLEKTSGELVKIPYTKLINQTVVHNETSEVVESFDFTLRLPKSQTKERWLRTLHEQVILLPWASVSRRPVVRWDSEDEECHTFGLRVHSLNARYAQLIENHLRLVNTETPSEL